MTPAPNKKTTCAHLPKQRGKATAAFRQLTLTPLVQYSPAHNTGNPKRKQLLQLLPLLGVGKYLACGQVQTVVSSDPILHLRRLRRLVFICAD